MEVSNRICWCGNDQLSLFSSEYLLCSACHTLVSRVGLSPDEVLVTDDDTDFYGKKYWFSHQASSLGLPSLSERMRNDLTERCLYWLGDILKYKLPPAKVLELGSSHGGFVALLRQAGYDAMGLELSPSIVDVARREFGVPMLLGPIEQQQIEPGSLDVIVLMDVLEHLPDPIATMKHCLPLLKADGILMIQTPCYKQGESMAKMVESKDRFLEMLKGDEHLYLFSAHSVKELFRRLGTENIRFEPAIFSHYDMCLIVGKQTLPEANTTHQVEAALTATPNGRLALAAMDLRKRELHLIQKTQELEADQVARGQQIDTLTTMVHESEADRAARGMQIEKLTAMVNESVPDLAARTAEIDAMAAMLKELEVVRAEREGQVAAISVELEHQLARARDTSEILSDIRVLFARPKFKWLARLAGGHEARKLIDELNKTNE